MDLLYHRYASPFSLINIALQNGQFSEFVVMLIKQDDQDRLWDIWLHKVLDKGWQEFLDSLEDHSMSEEQQEAAIRTSQNILNNFTPTERR